MSRRHTLSALFALYENWAGAYVFACRRGCSACCTRSVTMTTLEGELIHDYLRRARPELLPLAESGAGNSPGPSLTANQFAAACLRGEESEDTGGWDFTPCVFLRQGCCTIYPARPFMCRSFGSQVRCDEQGEAVVAPLLLTLNTVFMQCIEHLDRGRPWGNMNRILAGIAAGARGEPGTQQPQLRAQPLPGFLLLPEEKSALQEKLQTLLALVGRG